MTDEIMEQIIYTTERRTIMWYERYINNECTLSKARKEMKTLLDNQTELLEMLAFNQLIPYDEVETETYNLEAIYTAGIVSLVELGVYPYGYNPYQE